MKLSRIISSAAIVVTFLVMAFWLPVMDAATQNDIKTGTTGLSKNKIARMERFITRQMKLGKIPGMAVVVVKENRVIYQKGFGYADVGQKRPVDSRALFELGSTSKAFTALGILYLADQGLLNLNDPVKKYLPWFKMLQRKKLADPTLEDLNRYIPWFYQTQEANITIEQLLHHTSGIDPLSIGNIPPSKTPDSLEKTIRILMKKPIKPQLDYYPGERYSYATINYDILGLIITKITGQTYEAFMKDQILTPLGMKHTVLFHEQAGKDLATGYKVGFLRPLKYTAPVYRGNAPAGYIITSSDDMAQWLKVQMNEARIDPFYQRIVDGSHHDEYDYTNGWILHRTGDGLKYSHSGSNPNYSSYIEFRLPEKLGIALLINTNSQFNGGIGQGIMSIITGKGRIPERLYDLYVDLDGRSCMLIIGFGIIICMTLRFIINRRRAKRKYRGVTSRNFSKLILLLILVIGWLVLFGYAPWLFFGYNWPFITVWGPVTLLIALALICSEGLLVFWYLVDVLLFEVKHI